MGVVWKNDNFGPFSSANPKAETAFSRIDRTDIPELLMEAIL